MPYRYDLARRLEPIRPAGDLDRGFRAEIADPLWFLGRQWQLGEHRGEDAASPVQVRVQASHVPIDPYDGDPAMDPRLVPAEAIVESEPGEWWTPGRRVRVGLTAAAHLSEQQRADASLHLPPLPPPYDRLPAGALDGRALHQRRAELGLPAAPFADVPPTEPADLWDPAELVHTAAFTAGAGAVTLHLPRHDGGDVDWWSVSADAPLPPPAPPPEPVFLIPGRLRYPGAPHPRWWQIEDARVDVGGFPPDRTHLATMLLIDLIASHGDDWFTFPLPTSSGSVVTLHEVTVVDAFDGETTLTTPATWGLFRVHGLAETSLVVWPTVATPLTGPVLDDVLVGIDEDANLLWAVERRAGGRDLAPPPLPAAPPVVGEVVGSARTRYGYRPSSPLPRYWHPYLIEEVDGRRRFVQGSLVDLEQRPPEPMPEPVSPLLRDHDAPHTAPVHQIEPAAVPTTGLRLERRYMLARRTDGLPVLWSQRRRAFLLAPSPSQLRFDVVVSIPETTGPAG
ncbi:hypothetical protein ACI8AK_05260 [Geodermatophilus sp. SYSU D00867]